jgi:regulator of cell morphogenesis and NO signaling
MHDSRKGKQMFELSSETRVSELQAESQAMMDALKKTGIFRDGDDPHVTIAELCYSFGLHPKIMLLPLARALATDAPSDIDVSELDGMTLTQVVENIETSHHAFLREIMPIICQLTERVRGAHGANDSRLVELHELFANMSAELENHMLHEEEALFPMCRDMEIDGKIKPTRCGDAVGGPIACMENDHERAKEQLGKLVVLTDNFTPPEYACMTYRNMLEQLSLFSQNTAVHIHKEDKVLFPRAIKTQTALRKGLLKKPA